MNRTTRRRITGAALASAALATAVLATPSVADAATGTAHFGMVRSTAATGAGCLPKAKASVSVHSIGPVEWMTVKTSGLPANTDFDLFVTQGPDAPFGLSWYQGDIETNKKGNGTGRFLGRFNEETFTVAPGSVAAPQVHPADAASNPATAPVHQYHLGLWFNSPKDAAAAGCPGATTPFNGEHTAGVQALSTRQFAVTAGPLGRISAGD